MWSINLNVEIFVFCNNNFHGCNMLNATFRFLNKITVTDKLMNKFSSFFYIILDVFLFSIPFHCFTNEIIRPWLLWIEQHSCVNVRNFSIFLEVISYLNNYNYDTNMTQ